VREVVIGAEADHFQVFVQCLLIALLALALLVLSLLFGKRLWRLLRARGPDEETEGRTYSSVQFYERLISLMEKRGLSRDRHLTPLARYRGIRTPISMTAVPMTVSGERWHWKQHGSRDCADESDFAKES